MKRNSAHKKGRGAGLVAAAMLMGIGLTSLGLTDSAWAQDKTAPEGKPADKSAAKQVEITAQKQAEFDSAGHVATFEGDIKLVDPQFVLTADKLSVQMLKEGGIKSAEATGNVVIVSQQEKKTTEDSPPAKSTAKAKKALYDPKSGDVTLIGLPQIQQGINLHLATSDDTRMILNRDGGMKTYGPSKTVILEGETKK